MLGCRSQFSRFSIVATDSLISFDGYSYIQTHLFPHVQEEGPGEGEKTESSKERDKLSRCFCVFEKVLFGCFEAK